MQHFVVKTLDLSPKTPDIKSMQSPRLKVERKLLLKKTTNFSSKCTCVLGKTR
jgi:hypothetical protein